MEKLIEIAQSFLPGYEVFEVVPLKGGIIHETFKVNCLSNTQSVQFILQKINLNTFHDPELIMKNINLVKSIQSVENYPLKILEAIKNEEEAYLHFTVDGACWRMFKFIEGSTSFEHSNDQKVLFEMGKAYGLFLSSVKDIDPRKVGISIPDFHDLNRRVNAFQSSLKANKHGRQVYAEDSILQLMELYKRFKSIDFTTLGLRPSHNDCKLSNVLFDPKTLQAIAVIDLDTLMPGYIATDFGDMVRSVCNAATEDEADLSKVIFQLENFKNLTAGFLSVTKNWLSEGEQNSLFDGAVYIILEQAIRFMTDYLNGDIYYQVKYSEHNLDRARNQIRLLESMLEKEEGVKGILDEILT